jgi:hypothetical protein
MRLSGIRLPLLAATAWAGVGFTVYATDFRYRETVYVSPTSATVALAPTYVVSRSYIAPTDFIVPSYIPTSASYVSTSYYADPVSVLPTTYVATTYRRGLFGRRWFIERPLVASYGVAYVPSALILPRYAPTSYRLAAYRPTVWQTTGVWETAYASPATVCCDEVAWAAPAASTIASGVTSTPAAPANSRLNESVTRDDPTIPSNVDQIPDEAATPVAPLPDAAKAKAQPTTTTNPRGDSPPTPPAAKPDQVAAPADANKAAAQATGKAATPKPVEGTPAKNKLETPTAPGADQNPQELLPAPGLGKDETLRRESQRPAYNAARTRRLDRRNILVGMVESELGDRREEVHVSVVNRDNNLVHHDGLSNAFGGFAIYVPDGRWTVRVTMPSGRVETVRDVTVTNGKIMDNREAREVYNLIITF